jgi:predicted ATPase
MLRKLSLENFKGIGSRVGIELRPITLLFGPNSAGKSTFLQALVYLREILNTYNIDSDNTEAGGSAVDLGGFTSLIHNHDKSKTMKISCDIARFKSGEEKRIHEKVRMCEANNVIMHSLKGTGNFWRVEFEIQWQTLSESPKITRLKVSSDTGPIVTLESPQDSSRVNLTINNYWHPLLVTSLDEDQLNEWEKINKDNTVHSDEEIDSRLKGTIEEVFGGDSIPLTHSEGALPRLEHALDFDEANSFLHVENESGKILGIQEAWPAEVAHSHEEIRELLSNVVINPIRELRDALNSFLYLGPLREIPERRYFAPRTLDPKRWAVGLGAWDVLMREESEFVETINTWLTSDGKLGTGYTLQVNTIKDLPTDHPLYLSMIAGTVSDDFEDIKSELLKLRERKEVSLLDQNTGTALVPRDVGTGVSQVLPVLVAALQHELDIVAIEQPELHIHPAMQVALGDLFLEAIQIPNRIFLIETHSEHLMLRLLRRIRETTEGELSPGSPTATVDDLSVIYVEEEGSEVKLHQLRISEDGDFKDRWPKGFFKERAKELF